MKIMCRFRGWSQQFDVSPEVYASGVYEMYSPFDDSDTPLTDGRYYVPPKCVKTIQFVFKGKRTSFNTAIFESD